MNILFGKIFETSNAVKGKNNGFVTVFPFHSFLFGIIYIKNYFLEQTEKDSVMVFKTFF